MLQPAFDPLAQEWFVEFQGQELVADSLAELKVKCSGEDFSGYHPTGFVVVRDGFMQPSNRKPLIVYRKGPPPRLPTPIEEVKPVEVKPEPVLSNSDGVKRLRQHADGSKTADGAIRTLKQPPLTPDQLPKKPERIRYERFRKLKVPKPEVDRDKIFSLRGRGYHALEIADILRVPIDAVRES
jgi:hypothetical protein